ncbi:PDZ domain-containing protein [Paludisphaera rhizosphaerae]|uniref:PDZ domain-containing protein n=1 Tax=Paludisphaera rhizosphaerae TaxID=2711216 RepID=UPI0013EE167C|nr:PDZ domain-containing protein [Paludisphaera rhizosphaerae]
MPRIVRLTQAILAMNLAVCAVRADLAPQWKSQAPLVVEGVVAEVFRSARLTNIHYLVEVRVQSARLQTRTSAPGERQGVKIAEVAPAIRVPQADETIYVHCFTPQPTTPPTPAAGGHLEIADEGVRIRAYLYPRPQGGYAGAYPDWFDRTSAEMARPEDVEEPHPSEPPPKRKQLGLYTETVLFEGKPTQRVTGLVASSPAQTAGIQVNDLVTAVNGVATNNVDSFRSAVARSNNPVRLTVRRVATGAVEDMTINFSALLATSPEPTGGPVAPVPSPE